MNKNIGLALQDENLYPDEVVLREVLGDSFAAYGRVLDFMQESGMTHEWRFYKDGKAWLCKVLDKKRTIMWISAWNGLFKATIYIPLSRLEAVLDGVVDPGLRERISQGQSIGKLHACTFEIHGAGDLGDLEAMLTIKQRIK